MPPIVPDNVPDHFPAGTTVKFTRSLDDFAPADGWLYTIFLNGLTQKFSKAAAVQDGATFLIEFLPADTESLAPGPYRYAERLSNPGTAFVLTQVAASGGAAVYSFSSYSGLAPYVGMTVASIAGFVNSGNNIANAVITAFEGTSLGGTFTVANGAAVSEIHAATAAGAPEVFDIRGDELVINVEPDAATSPAGTFQTFEEKTLAVILAAIGGRLTADMQSYTIAGRSVMKIPIDELMQLRGKFAAAVWRQQNPGQLGVPYKVDFTTEPEMTNIPDTWIDVTGFER